MIPCRTAVYIAEENRNLHITDELRFGTPFRTKNVDETSEEALSHGRDTSSWRVQYVVTVLQILICWFSRTLYPLEAERVSHYSNTLNMKTFFDSDKFFPWSVIRNRLKIRFFEILAYFASSIAQNWTNKHHDSRNRPKFNFFKDLAYFFVWINKMSLISIKIRWQR